MGGLVCLKPTWEIFRVIGNLRGVGDIFPNSSLGYNLLQWFASRLPQTIFGTSLTSLGEGLTSFHIGRKNSRFFPFSMAPRNTGHEFHIYRLPEEEKELGKKKNVAYPYLTSWWVKDKFTKLGNLKLSLTHWHTGETGDSGNSCETGCFV